MNENDIQNSDALQQVEPQRREFLAKLIAGGVALPAMSSVAFAQGAGKGKGGGAGKAKGAGGKGKGGAGKGKGGPGTSRPDPAEFAARLLKEFDKDGDKALNIDELTAALTKMAERRGMQGQTGTGKGKGDGAGKGKGKGAGAGKGKGNGEIGGSGVKPKKPGT